ncbi:hypothetical protein FOIG_00169 [Fusarium odoratissimum NRRL 54006]|uniref:F-box domain-containing protein n=2 Tax=Fusarium oxysporum species complex TaxID=171631 RepID=X0KMH0_FUSO5|nr:uncharacterized protein FOIG_00169 [Fusarium odoratissimum NRRL 54006]EXM09856.1 hypothetical protein FOIG_00169 [Fusarium odoratissimum NRRL 54006]TXC03318.1 hypothetical protein FocTR4_00001971 [Fusarium oxysporum f. sp. cubense]
MSSPSNNTNYQQQSALPNLPTEILLEILDKDYLEWKDYYNLRRTSSRLSHLAREPMYRGGDYCVFRMACFRGDLDTLAICAQHGAVPTQCSRKSLSDGPLGLIEPGYGLYRRNTEDDYQECWHWNIWGDGFHGPGDVVTLGFYEGNFSAERFIEVWQWLSDQGCELFTFMKLRSLVRMGFPCFSFALLSMLPTATDKAHHQGICDVIHFLYSKGLRIPHPDRRLWRRGTWPAYFPLARDNRPNMLQALLQTNCPPSILELYLRQVNDEGLVFDHSEAWDPYFKGLETISQLLSILFDDMFAPWIYKGDSTRSMSDDLQAKICLLTQHQGANAFELYMLRDILAALRKIDARKESQGGLDFERDGVWCWYELCMAVSYISDEDVRKQTVDLHFTSPGDVQMIHPYLSRGWFPPSELAHARRTVLEKRALESGQKTEDIELHGQRPSTRKWAQMPLDAWDYILNWP